MADVTTANPLDELRAYPLNREVLIVSGPDAEAYLQGQLSQDIEAMTAGSSAFTFVLAPTGKVSVWFRISRRETDFVLDVDAGFADLLEARLTRFLLRTDATVERAPWTGIALRGPRAGESELADQFEISADAEWPGVEGLDLMDPEPVAFTGVATGSGDALDALRILAGVPSMGAELDDSTIPAAAGVVERSVSFTKGCYTGQELVARINSRGGSAPTTLCTVLASSTQALATGSMLTIDDADIGTITSAASAPWRDQSVGLAYVKRAVELPAAAFVGSDEVSLVVTPLVSG